MRREKPTRYEKMRGFNLKGKSLTRCCFVVVRISVGFVSIMYELAVPSQLDELIISYTGGTSGN